MAAMYSCYFEYINPKNFVNLTVIWCLTMLLAKLSSGIVRWSLTTGKTCACGIQKVAFGYKCSRKALVQPNLMWGDFWAQLVNMKF